MIPKPGASKRRRLGIPTVRDRVVQSALKLVLEPIFEADFQPCSYGFRPSRRAQDAIAEIHLFCTSSYEWMLEGDITACFDEIDHVALMGRSAGGSGTSGAPGAGEGVSQGRHPLLRMRIERDTSHRHASGRHPIAAAGQHRPLCARRAFRRGLGRRWGYSRLATAENASARVWPPTASFATRTTS